MPRRSKMLGGALSCPPGFFCMDTGTVLFGIFLASIVIAILVYIAKENGWIPSLHKQPQPQPSIVIVKEKVQDSSYPDPRFHPPSPERIYEPDVGSFGLSGRGGIPINSMTRNIPQQFQQIGVLTTPGGTETSGSPTRTILPLFGRTVDANRNRWNYYTRTDGINPVQVPVQFKRRNCEDDLGCEEITDGDSVGVPIMGQSFTANVYRYSTPRYLPIV